MYVVPEPANILAALMCALEQPHIITEQGGELFIVPPPGADKMKSSATVTHQSSRLFHWREYHHPRRHESRAGTNA